MTNRRVFPGQCDAHRPALSAGIAALTCFYGAAPAALAADSESILAEVVVTATKREVNIQKVPESITAISGDFLESQGIEGLMGYSVGVPGLSTVMSNPNQARFAIRGIPNLSGTQATVAFYVDEVPVTDNDHRASTANYSIFDIARVEVLRGPQGTLFGSSSMAGTIRVVTNPPKLGVTEGLTRAVFSATEAGGSNYGADALLNVPVSENTALRATVFYRNDDGFINRVPNPAILDFPAISPADKARLLAGESQVNSSHRLNGRISFLYQPIDQFSITLLADLAENEYANNSSIFANGNVLTGAEKELVTRTAFGEFQHDSKQLYALTLKYVFPEMEFVSASAWRDRTGTADPDLTSVVGGSFGDSPLAGFNLHTHPKSFTQEFRLASTSAERRVDWIGGLFYQHFYESGGSNINAPGAGGVGYPGFAAIIGLDPAELPGDVIFYKDAGESYYEAAAFGEATLHATDKFDVTAGLRFFKGGNSFWAFNAGFFNGGVSTPEGESTYDGTIPKLLVSYKLTDHHMVYASGAKGYRVGGGNSGVPLAVCAPDLAEIGLTEAPTGYEPDSLWNYEIGAKTSWLDNRLTVNAAVYTILWEDLQVNQNLDCGFGYVTNSGSATSNGAELEFAAQVTDHFSLSGGVGYAKTEQDQATLAIAGSTAGAPIPGVPELTFNLTADYRRPLWGDTQGSVSITYQYVEEYLLDNRAIRATNFVEQVSPLRVTVGLEAQSWALDLFAENLDNQISVVGVSNQPGNSQWAITRPRTIGARLTYKF